MNKPLNIVNLVLSIIVNALLIPWTIIIIFEQASMENAGTNMEMLVLYPWLIQILVSPVIIFNSIVSVVNISKKNLNSKLPITLFILTCFSVVQVVLFNVLLVI